MHVHIHDVAYPVELARLVKQGLLKVLLVDVTASDSQRHQHLTGALHRTSVGGGDTGSDTGGGEVQTLYCIYVRYSGIVRCILPHSEVVYNIII